ncbi:hypothetical protein ACQ4PT_026289 [Festuca glaucescens]
MLPVFTSSKFFAFRAEHNGKYLQSVYRKNAAGNHIEASGGVEANARTSFLVERSEEEEGLMHVQCCYNNKYWAPVQVQDSGRSRWIMGTADEPEEDLSSPSCTLFQALPGKDKDNSIRFLHSGKQKFACVVSIGDKTYMQLDDGDDQENKSGNFTVGFPQEFPKHVAFRGDNGKYLSIKPLSTLDNIGLIILQIVIFEVILPTTTMVFCQNLLRFQMKKIKDARAIFTTFINADGTVRIKSNAGGFWRRNSTDMILTPLVQQDDNDPDSLFEVVTRDGFIALRNLGNNKFCRSIGEENVLGACDDSISKWAKLKLEVPVKSREISDVKFNLDEARIYNKKIINAVTVTRRNYTSGEIKATFSFTKKVEMVSTWVTSGSFKIGVKAKFTLGPLMPVITGGHVRTSVEATVSLSKPTSQKNTDEAMVTEDYFIPPRTTAAGTFHAMRASCDVPYSYKQTDVLTTGEEVTTIHDDGIYTVANNYNFHFRVTDDREEIINLGG